MLTINGIDYITEKEASKKFGFSLKWFRKLRETQMSPRHYRFLGKGRIFYDVKELTKWFIENMKEDE